MHECQEFDSETDDSRSQVDKHYLLKGDLVQRRVWLKAVCQPMQISRLNSASLGHS